MESLLIDLLLLVLRPVNWFSCLNAYGLWPDVLFADAWRALKAAVGL